MNDSVLISTGLPIALAIIMFGLGLSLTPADFARVARTPRAVVVALLAVGVMLLAASPGGTTANLFSHLFRGTSHSTSPSPRSTRCSPRSPSR